MFLLSHLLQASVKRTQSDLTASIAASDRAGVKTSVSIAVEMPSKEQSIQDKRRQLLKQQRQKKMDAKIAMGLAPPSEDVSLVHTFLFPVTTNCIVTELCSS